MVNMKKLTSLILMAAVVLWNKKHEAQEWASNKKAVRVAIKAVKNNIKYVLKNGIMCEDSAYNISSKEFIKRLKARLSRLKKLKKYYERGFTSSPNVIY